MLPAGLHFEKFYYLWELIDVEAYVPAGVPEEDWERMEAKERESSKKPAPTSCLDGL